MKKLLFMLLAFTTITLNAQWKSEILDNGFEKPFKSSYIFSQDKKAVLQLMENQIRIIHSYSCDEILNVDFSFKIDSNYIIFSTIAGKTKDGRTIFFTEYDFPEILKNLEKANLVKIRINENHCDTDVYTFILNDTKKAIDFIK
jgi:hypothetical protein